MTRTLNSLSNKGIVFYDNQARTVFKDALSTYIEHRMLYREFHAENGSAPQHWGIPNRVLSGSPEHLVFLYFTTLVTLRAESDAVFRQMVGLWQERQEFFQESVVSMEEKEIEETLRRIGYINPSQLAPRWKKCAQTLFQDLDGNPLRVFGGHQSIDAVMVAFKGQGKNRLPGYGPKLLSLLALFYRELGAIGDVDGAFPVDLHVQRICITTGIITGAGIVDSATAVAEPLRREISRICAQERMDPLALSHALWFLGAKLCVQCDKSATELLCPVHTHCSGGVTSTRIYHKKGRWDLGNPDRKPKGPQLAFDVEFALRLLSQRVRKQRE